MMNASFGPKFEKTDKTSKNENIDPIIKITPSDSAKNMIEYNNFEDLLCSDYKIKRL